jgi:hypothetical protein
LLACREARADADVAIAAVRARVDKAHRRWERVKAQAAADAHSGTVSLVQKATRGKRPACPVRRTVRAAGVGADSGRRATRKTDKILPDVDRLNSIASDSSDRLLKAIP